MNKAVTEYGSRRHNGLLNNNSRYLYYDPTKDVTFEGGYASEELPAGHLGAYVNSPAGDRKVHSNCKFSCIGWNSRTSKLEGYTPIIVTTEKIA